MRFAARLRKLANVCFSFRMNLCCFKINATRQDTWVLNLYVSKQEDIGKHHKSSIISSQKKSKSCTETTYQMGKQREPPLTKIHILKIQLLGVFHLLFSTACSSQLLASPNCLMKDISSLRGHSRAVQGDVAEWAILTPFSSTIPFECFLTENQLFVHQVSL